MDNPLLYYLYKCNDCGVDGDMIEKDIMDRAMFLKCDQRKEHTNTQLMDQAVRELDNDTHLRDIYNIFDIDYNTYIKDMADRL